MGKKILSLVLTGVFLCFLQVVYAGMDREEYEPLWEDEADVKALEKAVEQKKQAYIDAKLEANRAALENFFSFFASKEEKDARKQALEQANEQKERLRQEYLELKQTFKENQWLLRQEQEEAKAAKKRTQQLKEREQKGMKLLEEALEKEGEIARGSE